MHSKTRAGVAAAAAAASKAHASQDLLSVLHPENHQQQQIQQQQPKQTQQQHEVDKPWQNSCGSSSSSPFPAGGRVHAGSKRLHSAAMAQSGKSWHSRASAQGTSSAPWGSPAEPGSTSQQHAAWQRTAAAQSAVCPGEDCEQQHHSTCQLSALTNPSCTLLDPSDTLRDPACTLATSPERPHLLATGSAANRAESAEAVYQLQSMDVLHPSNSAAVAQIHRHSSSSETRCFSEPCASDSSELLCSTPLKVRLFEGDAYEPMHELVNSQARAQSQDCQQQRDSISAKAATARRQQHQLHMIDLMLARVSAAEKAIQQGSVQGSCFGPYPSMHKQWGGTQGCKVLLHDMGTGAPVKLSDIDSPLVWEQASIFSERLPDIDDAGGSLGDADLAGLDDESDSMMAESSQRAHSSSGSSLDCPGVCFVPNDWLTDSSDEVELACFTTLPASSCMPPSALPLMPPSLLEPLERQ